MTIKKLLVFLSFFALYSSIHSMVTSMRIYEGGIINGETTDLKNGYCLIPLEGHDATGRSIKSSFVEEFFIFFFWV